MNIFNSIMAVGAGIMSGVGFLLIFLVLLTVSNGVPWAWTLLMVFIFAIVLGGIIHIFLGVSEGWAFAAALLISVVYHVELHYKEQEIVVAETPSLYRNIPSDRIKVYMSIDEVIVE